MNISTTQFVTFCYSEFEYSELASQLVQEYSDYLNELVIGVGHSQTDAINHLKRLHQLKSELLEKNYMPHMWPEYFLLHPPIKQYLEWAIRKTQNQEFDYWLKKLVSPIDLFILESKDKEFTHKMQCIYCCNVANSILKMIKLKNEHLLELFTIIKTVYSKLLENFSPEGLNTSTICIKQYVAEYKKYMEKAKQKYEKLMMETLLLPLRYDAHLGEFKDIRLKDLRQFNAQPELPVTEYFEIIKEQNITKVQAFLFELTADMGIKGIVDDASLVTNHIGYIVRELSYDLSPLLKAVLSVCNNDYEQIKSYLFIINKGPNWCSELDAVFSNSSIKDVKEVSPVNKIEILPENGSISSLQSVLSTLHLTKKYPQRLSLRDALIIKPEIMNSDINLSNLPYVVLHKIIACDYRSRSFLLPSQNDDSEASDSDSENSSSTATDDQIIVHPMDTILALFHCSDNFLRQVLLAKLSVCQMAIPLLLPDTSKDTLTLLLWALRSVKKTWNTLDTNEKIFIRKSSIVDYEGPIVSFLKCGQLQTSKSELLNNIIGEENIFFHWNLEHKNHGKSISQGVVELSCYYPSGDGSKFNDVIIFSNLRGNALEYTKQVTFIKSISFISFILMSKNSVESDDKDVRELLQMLSHSPGGLVVLLTDVETYKKEKLREILQCDNFSVICMHSKSSAVIQRKIRSFITRKLQNTQSQKFASISCHVDTARKLDIIVDEDDNDCMKGKEKALQMMKYVTKSKHDILPLQGANLWGIWGMHNKERYRHKQKQPSRDLSVAEYMRSKDEEKTAVRLYNFTAITQNLQENFW